ncbi:MAG: hypothetical protein MZV49_11125 [Rhodopseudomonas palustris]|nr:hypothetical protein [Rhodopseudomonas palustris]MCK7497580.1 hypothetical protein [Comamonadaceae bacterium]
MFEPVPSARVRSMALTVVPGTGDDDLEGLLGRLGGGGRRGHGDNQRQERTAPV